MRGMIGWALAGMLSGCGLAPVAPVAVTGSMHGSRVLDEVLAADVRRGFAQIFTTYDVAPRDERLSFREFGRVVERGWFDAHDRDGDGFMLLSEWLTPQELQFQVEAIAASGVDLVARADQDHDQLLSRAEFLAYTQLEVDPTPWLAGPADPAIKDTVFRAHADAHGQLSPRAAAELLGDLLAQGYYLDDGTDARALSRGLRRS